MFAFEVAIAKHSLLQQRRQKQRTYGSTRVNLQHRRVAPAVEASVDRAHQNERLALLQNTYILTNMTLTYEQGHPLQSE